MGTPTGDAAPPPADELRTDRAHSARAYDFFLGGKDNYPADREMAAVVAAAFPGVRVAARTNRAFLRRAGRFVAERGLRQFLDIGTGIPTEPNLHQVVQAVEPSARVLYVDNDPIVLAHAAALMVSDPRGATAYLQADAREPERILASPELRETLDLTLPVAVSTVAVLHFLDDAEAAALLRTLLAAVPPGSHLLLTHSTLDFDVDGAVARAVAGYHAAGVASFMRGRDRIAALLPDGLELLDPGLVPTHRWRAEPAVGDGPADSDVSMYGAVAVKR
jgi:hypothetical protein